MAWGARAADADERERLRQFTLGREELVAGDRMVRRTLRAKARERQRYWLGVPPIVLGSVAAVIARRSSTARAKDDVNHGGERQPHT